MIRIRINREQMDAQLKSYYDTLKKWETDATNEYIGWGRYFTQLNILLHKKMWNFFENSLGPWEMCAENVIWFGIFTLFALLLGLMYLSGDLMSRIRAKSCRITVEWNQDVPNRVGGVARMKLKFTEFPEVEPIGEQLENLSIKVMQDKEEIPLEKEISADGQEINVVFPIRRAGTYKTTVYFSGHEVIGSPFTATINPDVLDPFESTVDVRTPVFIVQGQQFTLYITPRDSYGNRCATSNDDVRFLGFEVKKFCCSSGPQESQDQKPCSDFEQSLFGIRGGTEAKASSMSLKSSSARCVNSRSKSRTYFSELLANIPTVYTLYGKCRGVGRYQGRVLFKKTPLPLSDKKGVDIDIIALSVCEETTLLAKEFLGVHKFPGTRVQLLPKKSGITDKCACVEEDDKNLNDETNNDLEGNDDSPSIVHTSVNVELTSRFVYLSEDILGGPLTERLSTLRLSTATELDIVSIQDYPEIDTYDLELYDPTQNSTERFLMSGSEARVFLALFYDFMGKLDGSLPTVRSSLKLKSGVQTLEEKHYTFNKQLKSLYKNENPCKTSLPCTIIKVRRNKIIETTLEQTLCFGRQQWGKPFLLTFYNEPVGGAKSAWIEWSEILMDLFFESNAHGMFLSLSSGLIHPNSNRNSRWTTTHYELAGKVVGKYLVENAVFKETTCLQACFVNARFSRSFLAMILSIRPTWRHVQIDDPEEFDNTFKPILDGNVDEMDLKFVGQVYDAFGKMETKELVPNGSNICVTEENKISYLNALANFRYASNLQEEVQAFVKGLAFLVPEELIMNFDENELELILCGSLRFSTRDLQLHHICNNSDWNPSMDLTKEWLWKSLEEMTPFDYGRFLQFVTGSSRLPGCGGFADLHPRLKITFSALFAQLPTATRRLHQICITHHVSYEDFNKALITACRKMNLADYS